MESTCTPPRSRPASEPKASIHHFDKRTSAAVASFSVVFTLPLLSIFKEVPSEVEEEHGRTDDEMSSVGFKCLAAPYKFPLAKT